MAGDEVWAKHVSHQIGKKKLKMALLEMENTINACHIDSISPQAQRFNDALSEVEKCVHLISSIVVYALTIGISFLEQLKHLLSKEHSLISQGWNADKMKEDFEKVYRKLCMTSAQFLVSSWLVVMSMF